MTIWEIISANFGKNENWGKSEKLNGALLMVMFHIRQHIGKPIKINNAYRDSKGSQHSEGNAVDFIVLGVSFLEACYLVDKAIKDLQLQDHIGLGIYLDWNTRGFHLDVRGKRARWSRISGKYLTVEEGLKQLFKEEKVIDIRYNQITF